MPGRSALAWRILAALALGAIAGELLGSRAEFLGEIATAIIQILKALAAPLVFLSVVEACSKIRLRWVQGGRLLSISLLNATVAGTIAITLDHFIPIDGQSAHSLKSALVAGNATAPEPQQLSFAKILEDIVPKSVVEPFDKNKVIGAVLLALFAGLALRKAKDISDPIGRVQLAAIDAAVSGALKVMTICMGWLVSVVPVAVFSVVARVVGKSGFESFKSLGVFLAVVCVGFFLQGVVYYAALLRMFATIKLRFFYAQAAEPLATAMGTGSSLATLPVTLKALEKMNVRPENARLAAMVGTNLNHDGILLYEAATALFVARALGVPLDGGQQILAVAISAIAAFGIGGIPDAGLITLSLVLSTLGLPLAAVPLLLPLDWLIGRMRATLNVTSDLVVANLLDAWDRKRPEVAKTAED